MLKTFEKISSFNFISDTSNGARTGKHNIENNELLLPALATIEAAKVEAIEMPKHPDKISAKKSDKFLKTKESKKNENKKNKKTDIDKDKT